MSCPHPDPKTVPWLFCRTCGVFAEGVRMGDATDEVLRDYMRAIPPNTKVSLKPPIEEYTEYSQEPDDDG